MNWLQHLIQQATERFFPFSEEVIRQKYTIHLDAWEESRLESRPPRQRWSNESLTAEHTSAVQALLAHVRQTHKPPARSSLSVVDAFLIAKMVFDHEQYDVYIASGQTEWVKPLMGSDSVVVFERLDKPTLSIQPLVTGDMVLFNWHDVVVMHYLTAVDYEQQQFYTHAGKKVPFEAVHSRLAAVLFTKPPENLESVPPPEQEHHRIAVDVWPDNLFHPEVPRDKPTPHSAISLEQDDRLDWRLLRRLMRDHNGDVWTDIANTNSMEPFLDAGTALLFERLDEENLLAQPLHAGDIVNWGSGQFGRLHRIIGRGVDEQYYIKGDNNRSIDRLSGRRLIANTLIRHRIVGIVYTQQQRPED